MSRVVSGRRLLWAGIAGIGAFLLVGALVYLGALAGVDENASRLEDPAVGRTIDGWFPLIATLWSPEACLLYGAVGAMLLWRRGFGRWSAMPLAFLAAVPLEVGLKLYLHRPAMPGLLKSWPPYALVHAPLGDSVLNGSAMRTGFLCLLGAALLWRSGGGLQRPAAAGLVVLAATTGLVRVYGRYHWLSGELGSQLLGAGVALLVVWAVSLGVGEERASGSPGC